MIYQCSKRVAHNVGNLPSQQRVKHWSPRVLRTPNVETRQHALEVECSASRVIGVKTHKSLSRTFSRVGIHCTCIEVLCNVIACVSGTSQHHHMGFLSLQPTMGWFGRFCGQISHNLKPLFRNPPPSKTRVFFVRHYYKN